MFFFWRNSVPKQMEVFLSSPFVHSKDVNKCESSPFASLLSNVKSGDMLQILSNSQVSSPSGHSIAPVVPLVAPVDPVMISNSFWLVWPTLISGIPLDKFHLYLQKNPRVATLMFRKYFDTINYLLKNRNVRENRNWFKSCYWYIVYSRNLTLQD